MEHTEKKGGRISVPQFGVWDQNNGAAVNSGYTVVFTKARADRQHQKTDLSDVKRQSLSDQDIPRNKTPPKPHHKKHDCHDKQDEPWASASAFASVAPPPMKRKRNKISRFFTCCIRP